MAMYLSRNVSSDEVSIWVSEPVEFEKGVYGGDGFVCSINDSPKLQALVSEHSIVCLTDEQPSPQPLTVEQAVERLAEEMQRLPDGFSIKYESSNTFGSITLIKGGLELEVFFESISAALSRAIELAKPKVPELFVQRSKGGVLYLYSGDECLTEHDCKLFTPEIKDNFMTLPPHHRVRIAWDEAGIRMVGDVQKIGG